LSIIAFCGQHGHRALAGAALAWLAGGSGVAGFLYGARHWRADLVQRVRINALIFAVLPVLFFAATSIPVLLPLAFVIGLGIAPTLITMFGLIEERVPAAAITEGLAWLTTGLNVGYGVAAAAAGGLADAHGARASFVVPVGAALLTGALTLILYRLLRRHPVASDARMVGLVGPG
jgi:predicted MFS family arabinose efflux permease